MPYKGTPERIQELRELVDGVEAAAYRVGATVHVVGGGAAFVEAERILQARRTALYAALYELVDAACFPPAYSSDNSA